MLYSKGKDNTLYLLRSSKAGSTPKTEDMHVGEMGINFADRKIYVREKSGALVHIESIDQLIDIHAEINGIE